jgi:hypothetical protein
MMGFLSVSGCPLQSGRLPASHYAVARSVNTLRRLGGRVDLSVRARRALEDAKKSKLSTSFLTGRGDGDGADVNA